MKISFITTCDHNIGDDFVREGLKFLLRQHYRGRELEFLNVHKHSPISARVGYQRHRGTWSNRMLDRILPLSTSGDLIVAADLVVQSGAPVYWCHPSTKSHCADNEWFKPLVKRRLSQRNQPFGNLAAGTCQGYHSDGAEFCRCPKCASYIKELSALSKVTTLRDSLASTVFDSLGLSAPVIACSSIFAVDEYGLAPGGDDYVVVNFMGLGGHYDFREGIDPNRWRGEFASFYQQLVRQEKVIFCCHDEKEVGEAKGIDPGAEIFYPGGDFLAAMKFYAGAKYGIFNRVHGAFMLASFGKPAVVIGNDSRARMAAEIGLPHFFMGDVDAELLCDRWRWLAAGGDGYRERFAEIKRRSLDDYLAALASL